MTLQMPALPTDHRAGSAEKEVTVPEPVPSIGGDCRIFVNSETEADLGDYCMFLCPAQSLTPGWPPLGRSTKRLEIDL